MADTRIWTAEEVLKQLGHKPPQLPGGRRSGRTWAMLAEAVAHAANGNTVMVMAHTPAYEREIVDQAHQWAVDIGLVPIRTFIKQAHAAGFHPIHEDHQRWREKRPRLFCDHYLTEMSMREVRKDWPMPLEEAMRRVCPLVLDVIVREELPLKEDPRDRISVIVNVSAHDKDEVDPFVPLMHEITKMATAQSRGEVEHRLHCVMHKVDSGRITKIAGRQADFLIVDEAAEYEPTEEDRFLERLHQKVKEKWGTT